MTNSEWLDLFEKEFNVSRTVAKKMMHVCMAIKSVDTEVRKEEYEKRFREPSPIRGNY